MPSHLPPYLSLFRGCIILRCVRFFLIFSLNYQQGARWWCICIGKWEEITKSSLYIGKLKANLWTHLNLAKVHCLKEFTSPYIISYLHFLKLNNILIIPKLSLLLLKLTFDSFDDFWHNLCLPCFLPAWFMHMHNIVYKIKTNASHLYLSFIK